MHIGANLGLISDNKKFPVVESSSNGANGAISATQPITMPSGVVSGDLLVIFISGFSSGACTMNLPSGWTRVVSPYSANNLRFVECIYKISDGTEGSSINITTTNNCYTAYVVYRISKYSAIEGTITGGSSSNPDSPSHTASWGTTKNLWFTLMGAISGGSQTAPANYTDFGQVVVGSEIPRSAWAQRNLAASSENPASFGTSAGYWGAVTVVVKPE